MAANLPDTASSLPTAAVYDNISGNTSGQSVIRSSAPGKVILFGEHAVVYGKTAIAASLGLKTNCSILRKPNDQRTITVHFPDVDVDGSWELQELESAKADIPAECGIKSPVPMSETVQTKLSGLAVHLKSEPARQAVLALLYLFICLCPNLPSLEITVHSELPVGAGLGSSASFSAAVVAGLLLLNNHIHTDHSSQIGKPRMESLDLINQWAFIAEKIIHGNPSGVDNAICVYGGAKAYRKGFPFETVPGFTSFNFLLTNTCVPKNTKLQVENVRLRTVKFPLVMPNIMEAVEGISQTCLKLFSGDASSNSEQTTDALETLIDMNHCLMAGSGVTHPSLERIRVITSKYGLYTKLTGAGGGGCALTLVRDDISHDTLVNLMNELKEEGFQCYETLVGGEGVLAVEAIGDINL